MRDSMSFIVKISIFLVKIIHAKEKISIFVAEKLRENCYLSFREETEDYA